MGSSVRVLRRTVNSGNERNPCPVFYMSQGTARDNWEEGEDDAKSAWPLMSWAAHVVQWPVQWVKAARRRIIPPKPVSVRIEGCNSPS